MFFPPGILLLWFFIAVFVILLMILGFYDFLNDLENEKGLGKKALKSNGALVAFSLFIALFYGYIFQDYPLLFWPFSIFIILIEAGLSFNNDLRLIFFVCFIPPLIAIFWMVYSQKKWIRVTAMVVYLLLNLLLSIFLKEFIWDS